MMPLTILSRMARRAGQGLVLGALALFLLVVAPGPSLSDPFRGAGEAVFVAWFALTSLFAAACCHVQFRWFYLGATAFFWYLFLASWLWPSEPYALPTAGWTWSSLGAIALVTAGVLFGRAAYGWAFTKAPTRW